MAVVRVREGPSWNERSVVGFAFEISGRNSTASTDSISFRRGCKVSRHIGSRLHQILRRDHPSVSNLRRAVPRSKSRWPITHMWHLSQSWGWPCVEVYASSPFHFTSCHIKDWLMEKISRQSFTIFAFHFSDFMQKGASLPAPQLIKVITRGRTSRLSADPLLEFFRPLEAWLEAQNRDEAVSTTISFCRNEIEGKFAFAGYRVVVEHGRRSAVSKPRVKWNVEGRSFHHYVHNNNCVSNIHNNSVN